MNACLTHAPVRHPWEPRIQDVACGYMLKLSDPACAGCYRARDEMPGDQLSVIGQKLHTSATKRETA